MCVLSDSKIEKAISSGSLYISSFDKSRLQPASYDVCLSKHMLSFKGDTSMVIDTKNMPAALGTSHFFEDGKPVSIRPGEFILASTSDIIVMPLNLVGRVEGKSSLGRIGLMVHSTAGYIDPGFGGQITLELSNVGRHPIYLYQDMPIAQISFMKISGKVQRPYGTKGLNSKYQHQFGPTESRYGKRYDFQDAEAC